MAAMDRELPDLNEIFNLHLLMNKFYNASVILSKDFQIFLGYLCVALSDR